MNMIASAMSAPGSGGLTGGFGVEVVVRGGDVVVLVGADTEGSVCLASPPTPWEQPPTSTDAAISTAIRIPARLAGRQPNTGKARPASSFDTVDSCTNTSSAQRPAPGPSRASP